MGGSASCGRRTHGSHRAEEKGVETAVAELVSVTSVPGFVVVFVVFLFPSLVASPTRALREVALHELS